MKSPVAQARDPVAVDADRACEHSDLLELAGAGVAEVDIATDGFIQVNRKLCSLTGYSRRELCQMFFADIVHAEDLAADQAERHEAVSGDRDEWVSERRYRRKDGAGGWMLLSNALIRDGGQPVRILAIIQDITERKQDEEEVRRTEQTLRESEARFRAFFELAAVGAAQADPFTCRFQDVNDRLCQMLGYTRDELLSMTFVDITHPDDRQRDRKHMARLVNGGVPDYAAEKRYVRKEASAPTQTPIGRGLRADHTTACGALAR